MGIKIISHIIFYFVHFLYLTYRFEFFGKENLLKATKIGPKGSFLISIWHQNILSAITSLTGSPFGVMVSKSKDGDIGAFAGKRFGYYIVRGSSKREGKQALEKLVDYVKLGNPGALTVDGPKGPSRYVKKGIIDLSKETGAPILPVSFYCKSQYIFKKSWDQFQLPLPFSKIKVFYGLPISLPQNEFSYDFFQDQIKEEMEKGENYLKSLVEKNNHQFNKNINHSS